MTHLDPDPIRPISSALTVTERSDDRDWVPRSVQPADDWGALAVKNPAAAQDALAGFQKFDDDRDLPLAQLTL